MAANAAAPNGFQSGRRLDGVAATFAMSRERIAYNYGTVIAFGDPVFRYTDGTIRLYASGGTTLLGYFRGCKYLDASSGRVEFYNSWRAPTLPSTTTVEALVDADQNMSARVQVIGTALTQADMGKNMDITASTSGVPNAAGISTCSLSGTAANTATLPFRLMRIVEAPIGGRLYDRTYDNQWVEVLINTPPNPAGTRTGQA